MTSGGTVLHWAAATGDRDMLAFLLERARDPNARSYAGQTPLHVAAGRGHDPCVRLLLSDSAQPDLGAHAAPWSSSAEGLCCRIVQPASARCDPAHASIFFTGAVLRYCKSGDDMHGHEGASQQHALSAMLVS